MKADEDHLRRFVARRDAGDVAGATACWADMVTVIQDRIETVVGVYSFRQTRLSDEEQEDLVQIVHEQLWERVRWSFKGVSMGELHRTLETMVHRRAVDMIRAKKADRLRNATSLDNRWVDEDGSEHAGHPAEAQEAIARWRRDEEKAEAETLVGGLIAKMPDERERRAVLDALDNVPAKESAEAIDVSMANLYQLRSRGTKSVARLMKEQDA